jgi:WD40 repeat protein
MKCEFCALSTLSRVVCVVALTAMQVFAVDWAADGSKVATGGKDCALKLWRS